MTDIDKWSEISDRLRRRARSARIEGLFYIYLMIGLAGAVVWFFSLGPEVSFLTRISTLEIAGEIRQKLEGLMGADAGASAKDLIYGNAAAQVMAQIGQWVLKVGAVFLAVFLTQIVVGFARYQFRMYHLLNDCADSVELAGGDVEKLEKIRSALATDVVDFGKMPQTQIDKALDTIKEVAKAATSRGNG